MMSKMSQCDVCSRAIASAEGFSLTTSQVVTNPAYWKFGFTHCFSFLQNDDPAGESLAGLVYRLASSKTGWLTCPSCSKMFSFDERVAKEYARRQSEPLGSGPANLQQAMNAAGTAWNDVFGKWPLSIKVPPPAPASSAQSKSDLPSPDEVFLFGRGFTPSKEQAALAVSGLVNMYNKKDLTVDLISRTRFVVFTEPATKLEEFFNVAPRIRERYPKACVIDNFLLDQKTGQDMAIIAVWDGNAAAIAYQRLQEIVNQESSQRPKKVPSKKWWQIWKLK